jgi:hypothetical protein
MASQAIVRVAKSTAAKVAAPTEVLEVADNIGSRHAFIPDEKYAKGYVHRKVNGVKDFDLLDYCRENNLNLLLEGDTGAGKTMFPMAYAAATKRAYYSVPCDVSIDPSALFGKMMPTDTVGKFKWVDGPVTEMVRNGGVLNISEINFMPPKIAASLYPLFDHRRSVQLLQHEGEVIKAHPDLLVVADMNPKYRGTMELNHAFANRFPVRVHWTYDPAVEDALVGSKALLELVRKMRAMEEIQTPIGTNAMMEFLTIAERLGMAFAQSNLIRKFADGEKGAVEKLVDLASKEISNDVAKLRKNKNEPEELEADKDWFDEMDFDPENYTFEEVTK